ncbi:hypothetical protein PR003_g5293 [Phytophthora rubi]|uniref:Uncharacterized protein n=1 Tax=Phytophthora rubi TaxID=129364 RepID=A0A6A4G4V0_9STRA|nr:hypothetical protein PR003_g5293 [Phytophthora rubi]
MVEQANAAQLKDARTLPSLVDFARPTVVVSGAVQMDAPRAVKEEDTAAVTERAEHQRWPSRQTS